MTDVKSRIKELNAKLEERITFHRSNGMFHNRSADYLKSFFIPDGLVDYPGENQDYMILNAERAIAMSYTSQSIIDKNVVAIPLVNTVLQATGAGAIQPTRKKPGPKPGSKRGPKPGTHRKKTRK